MEHLPPTLKKRIGIEFPAERQLSMAGCLYLTE
jgi:hypothetical protein